MTATLSRLAPTPVASTPAIFPQSTPRAPQLLPAARGVEPAPAEPPAATVVTAELVSVVQSYRERNDVVLQLAGGTIAVLRPKLRRDGVCLGRIGHRKLHLSRTPLRGPLALEPFRQIRLRWVVGPWVVDGLGLPVRRDRPDFVWVTPAGQALPVGSDLLLVQDPSTGWIYPRVAGSPVPRVVRERLSPLESLARRFRTDGWTAR